MITVTELLEPVEQDLETLVSDLRNLIGAGHPILQAAAEHLFSAGGKQLRPGIVLMVSRALSPNSSHTRHRRLAEITEMIHTASLVHDDVVGGLYPPRHLYRPQPFRSSCGRARGGFSVCPGQLASSQLG